MIAFKELLVVFILVCGSSCQMTTINEPCWQECFRIEEYPGYDVYKPIYNDLFSAGAEALRLASLYSANGTAFLFDTTLSSYHNPNTAMDSEESGFKIFQFQKDIGTIVAIMMGLQRGNNPGFVSQFDEEKAWTCEDWNCVNYCEAVEAIELLECVHTDASSYRDNKIEPACRLSNYYMSVDDINNSGKAQCNQFLNNEMAIAFVNSDFDHNVLRVKHEHGHGKANHYSSCQSHFKTRLVIGTHAVDEHEMDDWQSPDAHYIYIRDNDYTFDGAKSLRSCMASRCCEVDEIRVSGGGPVALPQDDTCMKVTEDYSVDPATYEFEYNIAGTVVV